MATLRELESLTAPFPDSAELSGLQALTSLRTLVLRGLPEPTLQEELLLALRRALPDCDVSIVRTE